MADWQAKNVVALWPRKKIRCDNFLMFQKENLTEVKIWLDVRHSHVFACQHVIITNYIIWYIYICLYLFVFLSKICIYIYLRILLVASKCSDTWNKIIYMENTNLTNNWYINIKNWLVKGQRIVCLIHCYTTWTSVNIDIWTFRTTVVTNMVL